MPARAWAASAIIGPRERAHALDERRRAKVAYTKHTYTAASLCLDNNVDIESPVGKKRR